MQYVPSNVTRIRDLPTKEYLYLALAPWFSAACTKSYLASARAVQGLDGLMFYIPNSSTSTPPPIADGIWNLNDGGRWKSENKYPVYAIPGIHGALIMQQLAQYSGNASSPKAEYILAHEKMDHADYVRLYTTFGLNGGSNLPTLWAFLLIVLAVVLFIIFLTSLSMHYYQRQKRVALERRIRNGEVDPATLGIKRLPVSQNAVNNLPSFIFVPNESSSNQPNETGNITSQGPSGSAVPSSSTSDRTVWGEKQCPICLEDFIPHKTTVRSLPCRHIYHPGCIDKVLLDSSSLCPVCKTRVVPLDQIHYEYGPVTNAMVRHERRATRSRLARETRQAQAARGETQREENIGRLSNLRRACGRDRRIFSAPTAARTPSQIEMAEVGNRAVSSPIPASNPEASAMQTGPPADAGLRRERMSGRMGALAAHQPTLEEAEAERAARMPACKPSLQEGRFVPFGRNH